MRSQVHLQEQWWKANWLTWRWKTASRALLRLTPEGFNFYFPSICVKLQHRRCQPVEFANTLQRNCDLLGKQLARFLANQPEEVVEDMESQKGTVDETSSFALDKAAEYAGAHHLERSPNSDKLYRAVFEQDEDLDAKRVKAYQKNLNGITAAVEVCQEALDDAVEEVRPWTYCLVYATSNRRVDM